MSFKCSRLSGNMGANKAPYDSDEIWNSCKEILWMHLNNEQQWLQWMSKSRDQILSRKVHVTLRTQAYPHCARHTHTHTLRFWLIFACKSQKDKNPSSLLLMISYRIHDISSYAMHHSVHNLPWCWERWQLRQALTLQHINWALSCGAHI